MWNSGTCSLNQIFWQQPANKIRKKHGGDLNAYVQRHPIPVKPDHTLMRPPLY